MSHCVLLLMLAYFTREDLRRKELPLIPLLCFGGGGMILYICTRPFGLISLIGGIIIGALLLLGAYFSPLGIGPGDGIILSFTGIYLGFSENAALLMSALFLSLPAAVYILIRKKGLKCSFPFVPFILAAYLFRLLTFP